MNNFAISAFGGGGGGGNFLFELKKYIQNINISSLNLHKKTGNRSSTQLVIFTIIFCPYLLFSQTFAPAPGVVGSTAIDKDSSIVIAWATGISVNRGFLNIANPSAGLASYGNESGGLGKAEGNSNDVISIGDSGVAIVTFERAIRNENGPDFAIFENGFQDNFLELAFVEVSSDGVNYFRFISTSEAPSVVQISAFEFSDCRYFNNLAGKYRQGFGTPFDLEELSGTIGLDIENITHVKLIDVVGSIDPNYGSFDSQGNIINDLYPTEFPSGGFDLDGVGVIHQAPLFIDEVVSNYTIYPNPTKDLLTINVLGESQVNIFDVSGKLLENEVIIESKVFDLSSYKESIVFVELINASGRTYHKIIIQ
jgi:hypothetical protein